MIRRAAAVLTAALVPASWVLSASADVLRMPVLTATNPEPGVVDLEWSGFPYPSSYVIVWQDGYDTIRANTGSTQLAGVSVGQHVYDVCEPGPTQDVCAPAVG